MIEIEKFDEMEIINITSDGIIPRRISCELSEDGHYYDRRMYFDAMEDTRAKEVIVTIRLRPQDLLYRFEPMPSDEYDEWFTFIINEDEYA